MCCIESLARDVHWFSHRPLMKLARVRSRHFPISKTTKSYPICDRRIPRDPIRELHAHFIRTHQHRNPNAMSEVIKSYALNQMSMQKARFAFVEIDHPTLPIWNHMIRGLSQSDSPLDALDLFDKMREQGVRGDNLTFIFACKASGRVSDVLYGKRVHVHVLKLGFGSYLYVCNALIHMYGSCGDLGSSRRVFDAMDEKDLVSWNSLICAYSQCAKYGGEWKLVDSVVEYIEDNCVEIDVYLGNTLIDVAAKSGDLAAAKKLFDEMPERDVISWTSMITGYCQANRHDDAITLFQEMMTAKVKPDQITVASVLSACAHLGRLDVGKAVHDYVSNNSIKLDIYVENALIDMYCKCGSVEKALNVFDEMKEKDSVSWTSVISGLAVNGNCDRAIELFSQMLREGTRPIHGTFVGILLACVHAGLVDKGLEFFRSMQKDYGLVPEMRHYGCVVDLLCRAGNLHRAYEFIKNMPVFPDIVVWRILLSACKLHGNLMLAKIASERLLELDPTNGGNYVLSSNSYASAERWDDAIKMRELMNKGDVLKPLGQSSIETNHEISRLPENMLD
ncbi:UNVERIFIED_CONTAM: Pentatricopeptide repeat-containing protein, mitochondrial [Sesamum calycinum]|uniref:Pentatricopeptide repeat-containing protein, mitochondrial n=1 Tax=Sesamum calycinum TaxID=2727403 RepID=A0AAW2RPY3_9LAMI